MPDARCADNVQCMLRPRARAFLTRRGDLLLAVVVAAVGLFEIWIARITPPGYRGPAGIATAGVLLLAGALVMRQQRPRLFLAVAVVVLTVEWAYARGVAQLPNASFAAVLLAAYTLGAHDDRIPGLFAIAAAGGVFLIQDGVDHEAGYPNVRTDAGFYGLFLLAWAAGVGIRRLRERNALLEQLTDQLAREREEKARLARLEERARLARELHDLVAHGVTVMVLNTGAARALVDENPAAAKTALRTVEDAGRDALSELRRVLGVLRQGFDGELRPPRGLRDLDELAGQVRGSGLQVDLIVEGEPRELPSGVALSAFRIVQEALTNTLKHASATRATVNVRYETDRVGLEIIDDGRGGAPHAAHQGHGLSGLRERAELYGGTVTAGPGPGGGFRVTATLPLQERKG